MRKNKLVVLVFGFAFFFTASVWAANDSKDTRQDKELPVDQKAAVATSDGISDAAEANRNKSGKEKSGGKNDK